MDNIALVCAPIGVIIAVMFQLVAQHPELPDKPLERDGNILTDREKQLLLYVGSR